MTAPRLAPCSTKCQDPWPRSPAMVHAIRTGFPPPLPSVVPTRRSSCRPGPRPCRAKRSRPNPHSGTASAKHRRARTGSLAESLRIHEAGPSRGGHRQVQAGDRRRAALAHGPAPGDRGGRGRPCAQPHAGAGTPDLRPHRLNPERGWANCAHTSDLCNTAAHAAHPRPHPAGAQPRRGPYARRVPGRRRPGHRIR